MTSHGTVDLAPGPEADPVDSRAGTIPSEVAKEVRLLVLDVDGVLTDAGVYLGDTDDGKHLELKRFDIQDGLGIKLVRECGVRVALVSGRVSTATALRAKELGLEECHQDPGARKLPLVRGLMEKDGLEWEQVAMLADDLPDLPVFRKVGLPAAVGNAVEEIRSAALWVAERQGGRGAVREFARAFLAARGEWDQAVEAYCAARDE